MSVKSGRSLDPLCLFASLLCLILLSTDTDAGKRRFKLSAVSLEPSTVVAGSSSQGKVTFNVAAPSSGAVVFLSSSEPSLVTMPSTVTVPAGATSATFALSTGTPSSSTQVVVSASFNGITRTATLTVTLPQIIDLGSISLNPSTVTGGDVAQGTVTLSAATAEGAVVYLSSSNESVASVPPSIIVTAGAVSTTFTVRTVAVSTSTSVTVSASFNGSAKAAVLGVNPIISSNAIFVSTDGNDANAGTELQPFRTIRKGVSVLRPGYTLLVKPGFYAEAFVNVIPGGSDWTNPVVIKAYDAANRPVIQAPAGSTWVMHFGSYAGQPVHHVIVDGFVLDGVNVTYDTVKITTGSNHIRIQNSEIKNSPNNGILVTLLGADYNEFINLTVHDNGRDQFDHGLYIESANNLVEGSRIYNGTGSGVHVWNQDALSAHNNVVRNNIIYGHPNKDGIIIGKGNGSIAYNNVIWSNKFGVRVYQDATGVRIYNNTVYNSTLGTGIMVEFGASNTTVENNIICRSGWNGIRNESTTGTVIRNNIVSQSGSPDIYDYTGAAVIVDNIVAVDPMFVDATSNNFRLRSGSPAIDRGSLLPDVPNDHDGIPRPQGFRYDIGAYER